MSVHRTATGKYLDINALRLQQEKTIAVGNSRQNARGDIIGAGGQIVKTRDEIMTEHYNNQKGSNMVDNPINHSTEQANKAAVADIFVAPISNGFDSITDSQEEKVIVDPQTPPSDTGGYSDAVNRSQELANKLRAQRSRI